MEFFILALIVITVFCIPICGLIFFIVKLSKGSPTTQNNQIPETGDEDKQKKVNKAGINSIRFDSYQNGLFTAARERSMLEATETEAANWINSTTDIEVVSITSTNGRMNTSTTVWYKFKATH